MAPPQSSLAAESIASLETLLQRLERTVRSNSASIDDARIARTVDAANELLQEALAAAAGEEGSLSEESSIRLDPAIFPRVQGQLAVPGISACLIDLDGTIYNPHGTISGADDFYAFLCRRQIPYVFLSNTGAKGAAGVRDKLQRIGDFYLSADPPPESKILTAAEAQAAYMLATVPFGAKIFAIAGGAEPSFWMELLEREAERTGVAELVASWEVHTQLSESLAKEWAVAAAAHQRSGQAAVFVVLFSDGSITAAVDPQSGELGHADWSFDVIKKASYMLSHGAHLVLTAEDAFNPSADPLYPSNLWPLPGPGMFGALFRKLMEPLDDKYVHVCGKGGREGQTYMVERALGMLREQGHDGDLSSVLIVGDRPRHARTRRPCTGRPVHEVAPRALAHAALPCPIDPSRGCTLLRRLPVDNAFAHTCPRVYAVQATTRISERVCGQASRRASSRAAVTRCRCSRSSRATVRILWRVLSRSSCRTSSSVQATHPSSHAPPSMAITNTTTTTIMAPRTRSPRVTDALGGGQPMGIIWSQRVWRRPPLPPLSQHTRASLSASRVPKRASGLTTAPLC